MVLLLVLLLGLGKGALVPAYGFAWKPVTPLSRPAEGSKLYFQVPATFLLSSAGRNLQLRSCELSPPARCLRCALFKRAPRMGTHSPLLVLPKPQQMASFRLSSRR